MKNWILLVVLLAVAVAASTSACQNQAPSNSAANANATAAGGTNDSHAGHDMSNMAGHDMANMQGHDMTNMKSDPNAAAQPYDLQFLDSMMHHHKGAIQMAEMVLGKTERPEMKAFAQKIIADQSKENEQMKKWRDEWYPGMPSAVNMELPGMTGGMKMMESDHIKEMADMEPGHFDGHFLKMMIAHHEGALEMSNDAIKRLEHRELKELAPRIVKEQRAEIEQMKKWQAAWDE